MIEVSCSNDALKDSFKRLIKYFEGSTPPRNMTLHIILQNDLDFTRRKLLDRSNISEDEMQKTRFIFLRLDDNHNQKYQFWEKIIGNIWLGRTLNIKAIINNKKEEGKDGDKRVGVSASIVANIEELCNENTTDPEFVCSVLKKLIYLQGKLRAENKSFKRLYIDEIDPHEIILHAQEEKKMLFYSYLRSAILDWSKQNDWVLRTDYYKDDFNFLIIDDLMCEQSWPQVKDSTKIEREEEFLECLTECRAISSKLSDREWSFYRLLESSEANKFAEHIKEILNDNIGLHYSSIYSPKNDQNSDTLNDFLIDKKITHILVDWRLDESGQYTGLNLVRGIKSWVDRKLSNNNLIPELLILSRNPDPVTIQSALEAGASGYVLKDDIAELPYIVGRAGKPLTVDRKKEIDLLTTDNFPSLKSFPAFVPKALYYKEWRKIKDFDPDKNASGSDYENNESIIRKNKEWLNDIPKADLHVHFGTAIPLNVCYDLAIISVYRWACQYCGEDSLGNEKKWEQLVNAAKLIEQILGKVTEKTDEEGDKFRDLYLDAFKEITRIYEVSTVNNTVKRLNKRYDTLSEELIACLIVTGVGLQHRIYKPGILNERIAEIVEVCDCIEKVEKADQKPPLLSFYLQDSTRLIEDVKDYYKKISAKDIISIAEFLINHRKVNVTNNPLSCLLSIPETLQDKAQGLPKYLGAGDLVGASLLQFTETLLLASYHIPKWACDQNVWHQELRAGPTGYLKGLNNPTIATKIMMLGLYAGIEDVKNKCPGKYPTTSVLISAKRHKDKEDIKKSVFLATEFVTKNENDMNDTASKNFVPKVLGMDLAGIERGYLPDDLVEQFRESFRRCLMMTVHAGEDESVESVWQAVYSLHASRIGHGLRLDEHLDLKRLFKDRQFCVELCPKSNQFTNGYALYGREKKAEDSYYVLEDYWNYGIPLTINTDNPLFSHRANDTDMSYPLSEEYLVLPHLLGKNSKRLDKTDDKPLFINRLLILKLIYNGFKHSFFSPKEKARLIECADTEVFNILAEEFLDVYISAER